jgi:hypothetical protein
MMMMCVQNITLPRRSAALFGCLLFLLMSGCSDETITVGEEGKISTEPLTQITFSAVSLGNSTNERLVIKNVGVGDLIIKSVAWEGTQDISLKFADTPPQDLTLGPNETYELAVVYAPTDGEPDSGDVVIENTDASRKTVRLPVVTAGVSPRIQVVPDRNLGLNFGAVELNVPTAEPVTITNVGQLPLTISNIVVTGSSDFALVLPADVSFEGGKTLTLEDSTKQVVVEVIYTPTSLGGDEGELQITSNDPASTTYILPITANSNTPCIRASERLVEFQNVRIGTEEPRTVVLTNCGGVDLNILGLRKAPGGSEEMSTREPTPLEGSVLAPNENTTFDIIYTPVNEGPPDAARFIVESNDPLQRELTIEALGTGTSNACPVAQIQARASGVPTFSTDRVEAKPLDVLILDGGLSFDNESAVKEWIWTLSKRPDGASSAIEVTGSNQAELFLQVAGVYEVCLEVIDQANVPSCFKDCIEVNVVPSKKVQVQLTWKNQSDTNPKDQFGPDVDLHFLRVPEGSWADTARTAAENIWDVYFLNKAPTWRLSDGTEEHPTLDIDDRSGSNPEWSAIDDPSPCSWYAVGIHYYSDGGFFDDITYANANFYATGGLIGAVPNIPLVLAGESPGDFYYLGLIHWDGEKGYFHEIYEKYEGGTWKGQRPVIPQNILDRVPTYAPQCVVP